jgi:hypothetical protein
VVQASWSSFAKIFSKTIGDVLKTGFGKVVDELKDQLAERNGMQGDKKTAGLKASQREQLQKLQAQLKAQQQTDASLQHVIKKAQEAIQIVLDEEVNTEARLKQLEELQEFLKEM